MVDMRSIEITKIYIYTIHVTSDFGEGTDDVNIFFSENCFVQLLISK